MTTSGRNLERKPVNLGQLRGIIRRRSPLPAERTEWILSARFGSIPYRLASALEAWPLGCSAVLDVGCSYGHCLIHFGPGSVGIDNSPEHVDFCRSLGLDARLVDVDQGLGAVPDGAFDFVWVSDIVEHLDAPRLLLRRLQPKLKPEGRLLLYVSALPRSRLARTVFRRLGIVSYEAGTHYYQFTHETVRFLLERAGYRVGAVTVPRLSGRYRPLAGLLRPYAPTLILEATIDEQAERRTREAELKNKPDGR